MYERERLSGHNSFENVRNSNNLLKIIENYLFIFIQIYEWMFWTFFF